MNLHLRLRASASLGFLAVVTNCLVASDGRDPIATNGPSSNMNAAGGSTSVGATSSTTTGSSAGSGGTTGSAGAPPRCSGPTPNGTRECGTGKSCVFECTNSRASCAPAGHGADGSACKSVADCGPAMDCVFYSDTVAICRSLCVVDSDCPAGSSCTGGLVCKVGESQIANYCETSCSDITAKAASPCGPNFKCDVGCNGDAPLTECVPAGIYQSGPCRHSSDCAAGFSCVGDTCEQACTTDADCTLGGTCRKTSVCGATSTGFRYCG